MTARALSCSLLLVILPSTTKAWAAGPSITRTVPAAVMPGRTNLVTIRGENLGGAMTLWTSFAAMSALHRTGSATDSSSESTWRILVPKDAAVGIGTIRVAGSNGLSSLQPLMIDDLQSISETATNRTRASAQLLSVPVAVDGTSDELHFDYYRFRARKGQRLSLEIVAQRLGSLMDPVMRVLDARGNELAYCDDDPGAGSDSRILFDPPASGDYYLELRDVEYQGGPQYFYRLRLGQFPFASFTFPFGVRRGETSAVQVVTADAERRPPIRVKTAGDSSSVLKPLALPGRRGQGSGFARVLIDETAEFVEFEPNDLPAQARKVSLPTTINGRFEKPKDRDCFAFEVAAGQRVVAVGRTRSLGSPCDLYLQFLAPDGTRLAESKGTGADEGSLTNDFKQAGTYLLAVEELGRRAGPQLAYRVMLTLFQPGFLLSVETDKVEAVNGGTFGIKVTAVRSGYDGPIRLELDGLGDGLKLEGEIIAEKKSETTVKVKLPDRFALGSVHPFRILGHAQSVKVPFRTVASTSPALKKLFPDMLYPPIDWDGQLALGIRLPVD